MVNVCHSTHKPCTPISHSPHTPTPPPTYTHTNTPIPPQPLSAFFGGVVAQEVVKFTGKYSPLKQWLHLDAFEALPATKAEDTQPQNTRYDDLIAMYGAAFVREKLGNARTFVVGCGALGCEYLKNFALLGVGAGPKGQIVVTDNDRIEVSNLNRQFLFREKNVGQPKSVAASAAALHMNGELKVGGWRGGQVNGWLDAWLACVCM
jgi:ubiquitin-activating enzyme E1